MSLGSVLIPKSNTFFICYLFFLFFQFGPVLISLLSTNYVYFIFVDVQNIISSGRTVLPNDSLLASTGNACIPRVDGGLGLVRGYLTSVGAGKQLVSNSFLTNFNSVLANPRARRLFSSDAPKKKSKAMTCIFCSSILFYCIYLSKKISLLFRYMKHKTSVFWFCIIC